MHVELTRHDKVKFLRPVLGYLNKVDHLTILLDVKLFMTQFLITSQVMCDRSHRQSLLISHRQLRDLTNPSQGNSLKDDIILRQPNLKTQLVIRTFRVT